MKKLFISRELDSSSLLWKFTAKFELIACSLIEFKGKPLTSPIETSWLFFYSKNGVKFLKDANPDFEINKYKIGCLGKGTSQKVTEIFNIAPDFIGTGDPDDVVKKYSDILNPSDSVTFVCASNSRNSIQKMLESKVHSESLPIYENRIKTKVKFQEPHIGIFTSPLNVDAYCKSFNLNNLELIIAIGKTTAEHLHMIGTQHVVIACEPSDIGLSIALEISTM